MPEVITIVTLVATCLTFCAQIFQSYFDYKTAEHNGHSGIYKVYNSNCCSTVIESDDETNK